MLSRGDVANERRNVAMSLVRLLKGDRVGAIGRQFGIGKLSSASSAIEKIKREICEGRKLRSCVREIKEMSTNSKEQICPFNLVI